MNLSSRVCLTTISRRMDRRNFPSKIAVRTSGKYRENVRTCAQVRLTSSHPHLRTAIANPPLYGVSHPRLVSVASSTASSTGVSAVNVVVGVVVVVAVSSSTQVPTTETPTPKSEALHIREILFRVIARPPLGKPEVRASLVYISQFSVIVLLLLTCVFHFVAISVIGDLKRYLTSERNFRFGHGDLTFLCHVANVTETRRVAWLIQGKRHIYICPTFITLHFFSYIC